MKPTIGLGILSWKAHETLRKTLTSYKKEKLTSLFDENIIYFSDISNADKKIAKEFGFKAVGGKNKGIAVGTENLAKAFKTDYILIVQNDNNLVEKLDFSKKHLREAIEILNTKQADLVRMRHRWRVGEGFADVIKYLKFYPAHQKDSDFIPAEHGVNPKAYKDTFRKKIRRLTRPFKTHEVKGRSLFIEKNPHKIFPDVIQKKENFFIVDSSVIHFSDQCFLTSKDFFLNVLMKYVNENPTSSRRNKRTNNNFTAPETSLNGSWWRNQHFKIAQGRGLFTHNRFDGSFRANHHTVKK
ncbi:MAG: hypothetical protein JW812_01805 [Alphaproteobacteria bacterium]|nr:hypothetical protein [Alphaproteobacteria bacterium]MBN2779530.1 hypothetical protein [Alphaproteobacteria bacterium]